jgi:putative tricarboxylic transport membrane protein
MAHSESWKATLTRLGWTDSYLAGPAFGQFLDAERVRVGRIVARLRGSPGDADDGGAGEWLFPVLVLSGSAFVLVLLVVRRSATTSDPGVNGGPVVRVAVGLVSFVALLNLAGFVAAGTVLFTCTASAFGSRRWRRDALLGMTFCACVFVTFTYGLGVALPAGLFLGGR